MTLSEIISYLNSPEPVVKFQKLCGIEIIEDNNSVNELKEKEVEELVMGKGFASMNVFDVTKATGIELARKSIHQEELDTLYANSSDRISNGSNHNVYKEHSEPIIKPKFKINNSICYYLFMFGAKLGEEVFYISFFPFWFWNVDGFVGRRLCVFWAAFMYLGQACKDVVKMPRPPSPPVVRMESKYDKEYGMPSTHAMVGAGLPFAIYFLTRDRYIFPSEVTMGVAVVWCSVVCLSRIYLGMHSLLDVLAGLVFIFLLMLITFHLNLLDIVDCYMLKGGCLSLFLSVSVPLLLSFYYPSGQQDWSTARSDTFIILAVCSGSLVAHWLNFNLGHMRRPIGELGFCGSASTVESIFFPASSIHCNPQYLTSKNIHHRSYRKYHRSSDGSSLSQLVALHPPYPVPSLTFKLFLVSLSRTMLGVVIVVSARFVVKHSVLFALSFVYPPEAGAKPSRLCVVPELIQKYLTYSSITIIGLAFCPLIFHWLNIERETYFTEL